jgi:hypothetical protein
LGKNVTYTCNFSTADCSQKSLKIGSKNVWKSLNFFGLGNYEPWVSSVYSGLTVWRIIKNNPPFWVAKIFYSTECYTVVDHYNSSKCSKKAIAALTLYVCF